MQVGKLDLFFALKACSVCERAPSTRLGCCQMCAQTMFAPEAKGFELWLGSYEGGLERAVRALKFHHNQRIARPLDTRLAQEVRLLGWKPDWVCAVPLHKRRLRERGYNQSVLVAKRCAKELALPYCEPMVRVRATQQQAKLEATERQGNVTGAFSSAPLAGERILLIDDVRTSGATTTECALALLTAGARRVWVATVAKATIL